MILVHWAFLWSQAEASHWAFWLLLPVVWLWTVLRSVDINESLAFLWSDSCICFQWLWWVLTDCFHIYLCLDCLFSAIVPKLSQISSETPWDLFCKFLFVVRGIDTFLPREPYLCRMLTGGRIVLFPSLVLRSWVWVHLQHVPTHRSTLLLHSSPALVFDFQVTQSLVSSSPPCSSFLLPLVQFEHSWFVFSFLGHWFVWLSLTQFPWVLFVFIRTYFPKCLFLKWFCLTEPVPQCARPTYTTLNTNISILIKLIKTTKP